jgi:DNA-binding NarL/FixJ family response regulator
VFVDEVTRFLEPERQRGSAPTFDVTAVLSSRELDVLKAAAQGRTNDEIAADLFLSARTVERHLQNIYVKLGVSGKAARTAAVAKLLGSTD